MGDLFWRGLDHACQNGSEDAADYQTRPVHQDFAFLIFPVCGFSFEIQKLFDELEELVQEHHQENLLFGELGVVELVAVALFHKV